MADREQPFMLVGNAHQCFGIVDRAGQRLFDQHMLAGFEGRLGQGVVGVRRRCDHDGIGRRIGGRGERIGAGADRGGDIPLDRGQARRRQIANHADGRPLAVDKRPNQVRPPMAQADEIDVGHATIPITARRRRRFNHG